MPRVHLGHYLPAVVQHRRAGRAGAGVVDLDRVLDRAAGSDGGRGHATPGALEQIRAETRLPVTIGIGTSKTLARLAGKLFRMGILMYGASPTWATLIKVLRN